MSESVEHAVQIHDCELLNLPQDLLVQLASGIGCSDVDLRGYLDYFKHFTGLQEQTAFNIQNIKQKYKGYGKEGEAAEAAYISRCADDLRASTACRDTNKTEHS